MIFSITFSPNYFTYSHVPMVACLKSHKSPHPFPLPWRTQSGLWQAKQSRCRLSWRRDKLIFHLNARRSEHWCKGYYPECPYGLANSAKDAHLGNSKKWKVHRKTKYIYYLLNGHCSVGYVHKKRRVTLQLIIFSFIPSKAATNCCNHATFTISYI